MIAHDSFECEDLNRKEIGGGENIPMTFQEVGPSRSWATLGSGLDSMILENVGDSITADLMAKIVNGISDSRIAPTLILRSELNDKTDDFISGARPANRLLGARIVLLRDEFSEPGPKSLRSCDAGNFLEASKLNFLCFEGQLASLAVIEARTFAMNFLQHANLLLEIFDNGLLFALDPTGQTKENEFQRIHGGRMADSRRISTSD